MSYLYSKNLHMLPSKGQYERELIETPTIPMIPKSYDFGLNSFHVGIGQCMSIMANISTAV